MDAKVKSTEFECTSCGGVFTEAAFAVVLPNSRAFPRIMIFCSQECYQVPFLKALEELTSEQRLDLGEIIIHYWEDGRRGGGSFPNAEVLLGWFEDTEEYFDRNVRSEEEVLIKEAEFRDPTLSGFARKIKRMLLSARPETSYPKNFGALHFLLGNSPPLEPDNS